MIRSDSSKSRGFTLIELLVVITIIGILSVIGMTLYGSAQNSARDGVRQQDMTAIARALEVNKGTNTATYQPLANNQFARGAVPQEPIATRVPKYSILTRTDGTIPGQPVTWAVTSTNPTALEGVGTTVATIAVGVPLATATNFRVCALLENGTAPNIFCIPSQQ